MSCAPPPPPPPGPAIVTNRSNSSNAADGRSLLLDSIRQGTKLKKTVTNDKSAPILGGNAGVKSPTSGTSSSTLRTNANNRLSNDSSPPTGGLGGLFVNGIPKLKATGLPIGQAYQQYRNENDAPKSNSSVNSRLSSNNVQNTHSNKGSYDSSSGYPNHHSTSSLTKVRGPPPQPPGPPPKLINRESDGSNGLVVHARSTSTVSLSENSYQNRASQDGHHPVHSHGKPSLAPKPPSIARAQSMRVPKSSISVSEINNKNETQFGDANHQSDAYRMNKKNGFPSFHQSQESLSRRNTRSSSPTRIPSNAVSWGSSLNTGAATLRPYNRTHGSPLRPPLTKPPPPPSSRMAMSPPMCPPPPPPTHAPPPPPHRLNPAPPPPPSVVQNKHNTNFSSVGTPPTPPVRNSSMRSSNSSKMSSFELRFISYFHNVEEFPAPQPFMHVKKIYNSKVQAKQQAPQPPVKALHQQNRTWQSTETTSNC